MYTEQQKVTVEELRRLFDSNELFALIDVREFGEYTKGYILLASPLPYSRIEMKVESLIPCKNVPVIITDSGENGDTRSKKAAKLLKKMGYQKISILENGVRGWHNSGYELFKGIGCPSKCYAAYLEQKKHVPGYFPKDVQEKLKNGEKIAFIDIRREEEFLKMCLPNGLNAPGCDSAYRFLDLVPDPETLVLVNCGARTRSILFAQTLIDFGVPNPVATLKGGTLNWKRNGYELRYGNDNKIAPPSAEAIAFSHKKAKSLADKLNIQFIDKETLEQWQIKSQEEPLYVFDVRLPGEYAQSHLQGSMSAPGGHLAQCITEFIAVRNAKVVLIDDTEVRSIITAYWLKELSVENVCVLKGGLGGSGIGCQNLTSNTYSISSTLLDKLPQQNSITPSSLLQKNQSTSVPLIIDIGYSNNYRNSHIPSSIWCPRGWLEEAHKKYENVQEIIITSDDELHARLTVEDAKEIWPQAKISYLEGGTPAWNHAQFPSETGMKNACVKEDDIPYLWYTDPNITGADMDKYFDWENKDLAQLLKDKTFHYNLLEV